LKENGTPRTKKRNTRHKGYEGRGQEMGLWKNLPKERV
jgi:hypothetical protein